VQQQTLTQPETEQRGEALPGVGDKCVFVVFNPVSGRSDPDERKKAISDALARHGYTCQFIVTSEERGAKALTEEAIQDGVDLVAVSGGDGTVMEVLHALVGTDIPVAILPAGTGNLLSTNLGIPGAVPDAVEVALSGLPYSLDLARSSEGRYFAIMGGMGLDGKVIEEADREAKNRLGVLAYFWAAAKNLSRRREAVVIRLDDRPPLRRRAKSVLIANMGKITGGLEALPTAAPDDGLLDVAIVKARTFWQWLRLFGYAVLGRTQEAPEIEVYQARRIRLTSRRPEPVEFDGEEAGRMSSLTVEVVPSAVRVLLPKDAPAARDTREPPVMVARRSARNRLLLAGGAVLALTVAGVLGVRAWQRLRRRSRP